MPPRKRKREPRPVVQLSDSPNLISTLPDEVLASVLSLLPIKESVRTSILSSRWRHLWSLSSLDIDDSSLVKCNCRYCDDQHDCFENYLVKSREIVSRIFSSHSGPIRSCRLSHFDKEELYPNLDGFIETLIKRGIEELDLFFLGERYKLPGSIASCKSLSKLRIEYCLFLDPPFSSTSFQNLKDLQIDGGKLSEETVHCILASCLCLESLHLIVQCDASLLQFSSPTLRKLHLRIYNGIIKQITIADTQISSS